VQQSPVQVTGVSGVTAVAGGQWHSLALKDDGSVWAWGNNTFGQLGVTSTRHGESPEMVAGLTDVRAISSGEHHCLALKKTVVCGHGE